MAGGKPGRRVDLRRRERMSCGLARWPAHGNGRATARPWSTRVSPEDLAMAVEITSHPIGFNLVILRTRGLSRHRRPRGVHPRERGGTSGEPPAPWRGSRVHPRERGGRPVSYRRAHRSGSIRANAGLHAQGRSARWMPGRSRVHPRERGGCRPGIAGMSAQSGPSARTRGCLVARCVGSRRGVHPRERGGCRTSAGKRADVERGPSARTRGQLAARTSRPGAAGSIRANAGLTLVGPRLPACIWRVHPRERGGCLVCKPWNSGISCNRLAMYCHMCMVI